MRAGAVDSRLEVIAGVPVGIRTTAGSTASPGMGSLTDRTLYCVARILNTDNAYQVAAQLGSTPAAGSILLQTSGSGSSNMLARVDTVAGSSNVSPYNSVGVRVPGVTIVGFVQTQKGMTLARAGWGTPTGGTTPITPGSGMETAPTLTLMGGNASMLPLCAVAYTGTHDATTRTRIMAWLKARYPA